MTLSMIVAMTKDRVIGRDNDLPWPRIKEDMKHFKTITKGHAVIMGRKTWESIPAKFRPLPGRTNIVVTRQKDLQFLGAHHTCNSIEDAISFAQKSDTEPMIIGGAGIYKAALPLASRIYLTLVKDDYEGDTYFPKLNPLDEWEENILLETDKVIFKRLDRV